MTSKRIKISHKQFALSDVLFYEPPYFTKIKIEPCFEVSDGQIEMEQRKAEAVEEYPPLDPLDRPGG